MTDPIAAVTDWLGAARARGGDRARDACCSRWRAPSPARVDGFGSLSGERHARRSVAARVTTRRHRAPALAAWIEPGGPGLAGRRTGPPRWLSGRPAPLRSPSNCSCARSGAGRRRPAWLAALLSDRPTPRRRIRRARATLGRLRRHRGASPPPTEPAGVTVHRRSTESLATTSPTRSMLDRVLGSHADHRRARVGRRRAVAHGRARRTRRAPRHVRRCHPRRSRRRRQPATGEWFVVLAARADAKLASGDPDGIGGQAARLERVLARSGAARQRDRSRRDRRSGPRGRARGRRRQRSDRRRDARHARGARSRCRSSTSRPPPTPLRVLAALDNATADAPRRRRSDLARGRACSRYARSRASRATIRCASCAAPAAAVRAVRAGLNVHAVFGVLSRRSSCSSALTELVLVGVRRAEAVAPSRPNRRRCGQACGCPSPSAGQRVSSVGGHVTVEVAGVERSGRLDSTRGTTARCTCTSNCAAAVAGSSAAPTRRACRARATTSTCAGWRPTSRCRSSGGLPTARPRVSCCTKPTGARALPAALGRAHNRCTTLAPDEATPALPEVRVLLSALTEALALATRPIRSSRRRSPRCRRSASSTPTAARCPTRSTICCTTRSRSRRRHGRRRPPGRPGHGVRALDRRRRGASADSSRGPPAGRRSRSTSRRAGVRRSTRRGAGRSTGRVHATIPIGGKPGRLARRSAAAGTTPAGGAPLRVHHDVPHVARSPASGTGPAPRHPRRSTAGRPPTRPRFCDSPRTLVPAETGALGARVPPPARRGRPPGRRRGARRVRPARDRRRPATGLAPVRLPLALVTDPLGWFAPCRCARRAPAARSSRRS